MPKSSGGLDTSAVHVRIAALADEAIRTARLARKHRKSLSGTNFYADKLAEIRIDAVNAFRELSQRSVGDTSALAELIEVCFSPTTASVKRLDAKRSLVFELRTTWKETAPGMSEGAAELFPLSLMTQAKRGYLNAITRQMNGCYSSGWYDSAAVMMRRLLEIVIIEAFEGRGLEDRIKQSSGDYLQLSDLVGQALAQSAWSLSRNTRRDLGPLRDLGHRSAHGRYFCAQRSDIDRAQTGFRVAIEEFLRISGLL